MNTTSLSKAVAAVLIAICAFSVESRGQISFVNDATSYDFGEIHRGDAASHNFEFRNSGATELKIVIVKCNNPHVKFRYPATVKAGKKRAITVMFSSSKDDEAGSFQNDITIVCSPASAVSALHIKGAIVPVHMTPLPKSFDTSTSIKIPLPDRKRQPEDKN